MKASSLLHHSPQERQARWYFAGVQPDCSHFPRASSPEMYHSNFDLDDENVDLASARFVVVDLLRKEEPLVDRCEGEVHSRWRQNQQNPPKFEFARGWLNEKVA